MHETIRNNITGETSCPIVKRRRIKNFIIMDTKLLEAILQELQKTNTMLQKFLTNAGESTEDAMHSYLASIYNKVDSIANDLNSLKNKKVAK